MSATAPASSAAEHQPPTPIGDPERHIRIATWNLWWRFGPWERRGDAIAEHLQRIDADVITLQEVWATPEDHHARRLADTLEMHWAAAPYRQPERWQRRLGVTDVSIELAILSRWPIRDIDHHPLPAGADPDEGRIMLHAITATPWGTLPVTTTHLNSHPAHSDTRRRQTDAVAHRVAATPAGDFPVVVTGDFNAMPDSDEVRRFEGHLTAPAIGGQILVDAWRYAPPNRPAATWDRNNPHVAAAHEPSARVDYVFVQRTGAHRRGNVHDVSRFGTEPIEGVWPSDHTGLYVDITTGTSRKP